MTDEELKDYFHGLGSVTKNKFTKRVRNIIGLNWKVNEVFKMNNFENELRGGLQLNFMKKA